MHAQLLTTLQENPYNNSLSPILPCPEFLKAKLVLPEFSADIYYLVYEVNIISKKSVSFPNEYYYIIVYKLLLLDSK